MIFFIKFDYKYTLDSIFFIFINIIVVYVKIIFLKFGGFKLIFNREINEISPKYIDMYSFLTKFILIKT